MTTRCAVHWCTALATHDAFCSIHAKDRTIRPMLLAADEEMADDALCYDCDGSGECENCNGTGDCCCECRECGSHECGVCEGSGRCGTCTGTGRLTYRKVESEASAPSPATSAPVAGL